MEGDPLKGAAGRGKLPPAPEPSLSVPFCAVEPQRSVSDLPKARGLGCGRPPAKTRLVKP